MATIVYKKEEFLKEVEKIIEDNEYVIFTNDIHGTLSADSKKIPAKRIPFAFNKGAFNAQGTVKDILESKLGAFSIVKLDALSERFKKEIKDENEVGNA